MESLDSLDKECSALGGLFQQVVNDMKVRILIPNRVFLLNRPLVASFRVELVPRDL